MTNIRVQMPVLVVIYLTVAASTEGSGGGSISGLLQFPLTQGNNWPAEWIFTNGDLFQLCIGKQTYFSNELFVQRRTKKTTAAFNFYLLFLRDGAA